MVTEIRIVIALEEKYYLGGDIKDPSGVLEMFCIAMRVLPGCTSVKIHRAVHLRLV